MSQTMDEASSLDTLLGKYGAAGGRKRSLRLSESGESPTDDCGGDWSSGREEPTSQFLKEIRERAQILSKNAAKSRKAALQTVVNEDHRGAPTTSESHSLDLFMDVIRNAAILDDSASRAAAATPPNSDSNGDDLLQPVVPLDAAPWAAEDEDGMLASGDYFQGEGGVRPWGVTTTESCVDASDDEDDDDDDESSDESETDEDIDGAITGHSGLLTKTEPEVVVHHGVKTDRPLKVDSSDQADRSQDLAQKPDSALTGDDVSLISSDDADERMPGDDMPKQKEGGEEDKEEDEEAKEEEEDAEPEFKTSPQTTAMLPENGSSIASQLGVKEGSGHSPQQLSELHEGEGQRMTKQRVEAVLDDLLQGEAAGENLCLDWNGHTGRDQDLRANLATHSSPTMPEMSREETSTPEDGPSSSVDVRREAGGVTSTEGSHSRPSKEPACPRTDPEEGEPPATLRQGPQSAAGRAASLRVNTGKTDRVNEVSRVEVKQHRNPDPGLASDSLPGGRQRLKEPATFIPTQEDVLSTDEATAEAGAVNQRKKSSTQTGDSKSEDVGAKGLPRSERACSNADRLETGCQEKPGKITRPTVLFREGAACRHPDFEKRPGDRVDERSGLKVGVVSSSPWGTKPLSPGGTKPPSPGGTKLPSPGGDLRASLRGLAGFQKRGTQGLGGGEPSPKSPGSVRDLIARFNSGSASSSPANSPRYEKVVDWNVFPSRAKQRAGQAPANGTDASTTYPLRGRGSSSDGSPMNIPWMRELRERRKRREQGHVLAEMPP